MGEAIGRIRAIREIASLNKRLKRESEENKPIEAIIKSFKEISEAARQEGEMLEYPDGYLSIFDKTVYTGICNLWLSGRTVFTLQDVYDSVWDWRLKDERMGSRKSICAGAAKSIKALLAGRVKRYSEENPTVCEYSRLLNGYMAQIVRGEGARDVCEDSVIYVQSEPVGLKIWRKVHFEVAENDVERTVDGAANTGNCNEENGLAKFNRMHTVEEQLAWIGSANAYVSSPINLRVLKKFEGKARLYVKQGRFVNTNGTSKDNLVFLLKSIDDDADDHIVDVELREE